MNLFAPIIGLILAIVTFPVWGTALAYIIWGTIQLWCNAPFVPIIIVALLFILPALIKQ